MCTREFRVSQLSCLPPRASPRWQKAPPWHHRTPSVSAVSQTCAILTAPFLIQAILAFNLGAFDSLRRAGSPHFHPRPASARFLHSSESKQEEEWLCHSLASNPSVAPHCCHDKEESGFRTPPCPPLPLHLLPPRSAPAAWFFGCAWKAPGGFLSRGLCPRSSHCLECSPPPRTSPPPPRARALLAWLFSSLMTFSWMPPLTALPSGPHPSPPSCSLAEPSIYLLICSLSLTPLKCKLHEDRACLGRFLSPLSMVGAS